MKTHFAAVAFAAVTFSLSQPAFALNSRSWVAHNGNDHNDCTLDHPCRTFQRAHDMTQQYGEVDVVDPADYGPLVINHSITIDGANMGFIYVNIETAIKITSSAYVIIRNLSIDSDGLYSGQGVLWQSSGDLYLDNVSIHGAVGIFVDSIPLILPGTRPRYLNLEGVKIQNCAYALMVFNPGGFLVPVMVNVRNSTFEAGVDLGNNTTGINMTTGRAVVTDTIVTGFDTAVVAAAPAEINLSKSTLSHSGVAVSVLGNSERGGGSVVRLASNDIVDNVTAFTATGNGQILSFGTNRTAGNGSIGASPVKIDLN